MQINLHFIICIILCEDLIFLLCSGNSSMSTLNYNQKDKYNENCYLQCYTIIIVLIFQRKSLSLQIINLIGFHVKGNILSLIIFSKQGKSIK